jgi:YegS/Rv2252/BmrU family lipid kinase
VLVVAQLLAQAFHFLLDIGHGGYNRGIVQFRQPVLIYNPAAGRIRRNPEGILQRTKGALGRAGLSVDLLPTKGPGQAAGMAREAIAAGADAVFVLGGDGTVNETIQGMAHSNVPLGVLPGGTANCLAMELGLGSRIERAVERLAASEPESIALGRITPCMPPLPANSQPRYFLLMCGAGLDATIVDEVSAPLKASTGKFAYWVAGLSQFRRYVKNLTIRVNGHEYECGFVLVSRIRNYGGDMEIATGASLRRDDFEVVFFQGKHPMRYGAYMLGVAARVAKRMPGVHSLYATSVEILTGAPSQVDGEFYGRETVKIDTVPNALTLLLPPSYG